MAGIIKPILKAVDRILGTLLGGILYLTKCLIMNAVILAALALAAPIGLLAFVFSFIPFMIYPPRNREMQIGMLGLSAILFASMITTFIDAARAIYQGTVDGYKHGLTFTLRKIIVRFSAFNLFLHKYQNSRPRERGVARHHARVAPSTRQPLQIPDGIQPDNPPTLLTHTEIDQASRLPALTVPLARYQDLSTRHIARDVDDPDTLDDELISLMPVPRGDAVLLVKEVNLASGEWRVVSIGSYLSSREQIDNFLSGLGEHHPHTRDNLRDPAPVDGMATRYSLVPYLGPQSDKELHQLAEAIRTQLDAVPRPTKVACEPVAAAAASTTTPNPVSPELLRFFRAELMARAAVQRQEQAAYSALLAGL